MRKKTKLVYGVGVNDADYPVQHFENGKPVWICPYYSTWVNMLKRAYSYKHKQKRPTYEGVTVCGEWHALMNFRSWMETQNWEGRQLDKDVIFQGNKVYSPETCAFVDGVTNTFMTDSGAARGEWPIGVHWVEGCNKFRSQCSNPFAKKLESLGYFTCPQEAHKAWRKRKHELACQLADTQTDARVAEALRTRYKQ